MKKLLGKYYYITKVLSMYAIIGGLLMLVIVITVKLLT